MGRVEDLLVEGDRQREVAEARGRDNVELREMIDGLCRPGEGRFAEDYYAQGFEDLNNRYDPGGLGVCWLLFVRWGGGGGGLLRRLLGAPRDCSLSVPSVAFRPSCLC